MVTAGPRADLIRSLLQSCYIIEAARAAVLGRWAGDFVREAQATAQRADRLSRLLTDRDIPSPDGVVEAHTSWVESLCGATPTDVPLGAALLQRLGVWSDVYVAPYLDDAEEFQALGESETQFPVPPRHVTRDEAFLPDADLPAGRRFVIFTDVHVGARHISDELAPQAIADINRLGPEFVLLSGDITDDGEPEQFDAAKALFDRFEMPYHVVLGNHDAVRRSTREACGAELFSRAFGRDVIDHVVECGDLQVALIDSTDPTPSPFPDWDLARGGFREDAAGVDNGALRPGQADALAARLDPGRPTLLVEHHELQPFPGFPPVKFGMRHEDSDALLGALHGHNLIGVVAGHTHRSAVLGVGDGSVTQLEIPSLKDWPFCYTVVTVNDGRVAVTPRQISDAELVWARSERGLTPIYRNYVLGPLSDLTYTFGA